MGPLVIAAHPSKVPQLFALATIYTEGSTFKRLAVACKTTSIVFLVGAHRMCYVVILVFWLLIVHLITSDHKTDAAVAWSLSQCRWCLEIQQIQRLVEAAAHIP